MSVSFKSILEIMKLNVNKSKEKQLPQIVELKDDINFEIPKNIEEMNEILKRYDLPIYLVENSAENKLQWFERLNNEDVFKNITVNEIKKNYINLKQKLDLEKKCDMLEIEIANMHAESEHPYYIKSIEELKNILYYSKAKVKRIKWSEEMRSMLEEIRIKKSECWEKFIYLKNNSEGAYYKIIINEKLKEKTDEGSKVLLKIVNERISNIEKIGNDLEIERVNLLKIIYHMSSRNIIEYDRLNGTVHLVGSEIKQIKND